MCKCYIVYVDIQEDEIWEFFNDCGIISAVRLVRDNATGVSKGFGYVDFEVSIENNTTCIYLLNCFYSNYEMS
jgi:RNA recognition motif-containing protein